MLTDPRTKTVELRGEYEFGGKRVKALTVRVPTLHDEIRSEAEGAPHGPSAILRRLALLRAVIVDADPTIEELRNQLTRADGRRLFLALREIEDDDTKHATRILSGDLDKDETERVNHLASLIALHRATGMPWNLLLRTSAATRSNLFAAAKQLNEHK